MTPFYPTHPRTEEEWREYMALTLHCEDGTDMKVSNIGFDHNKNRALWYVPFGKDPMNVTARVYAQIGGFSMPIDPRYWYDQNRTPLFYKEIYRGEAERWTRGYGEEAASICVPYESDWEASR